MPIVNPSQLLASALAELQTTLARVVTEQLHDAVALIRSANRVAVYGVGREGLMMRAFAMRLYHLGLDCQVVGDMATPPLGENDLLIVSAGPGYFSTVLALTRTAQSSGAKVLCVTAEPDGEVPRRADQVLVIPAQTMANDQGPAKLSVLPMGSLYEGAQYMVFEIMVLLLRDAIGTTPDAMRARHTNLE